MRGLAGFLLLTLLASCAPPSSFPGPPPNLAERGIGGTGSPSSALTAERGIGGTGIVGVITGFGSIFVDGLEVHYDAGTPVTVDDASASPAALRKGQVVAVAAEGPTSALMAESVSVVHEVAGPVEAIEDGGRMVRVAGQEVVIPGVIPDKAGGGLARGAWVAVSGLKRPDGAIVATRIDPSPAGLVRVRGRLAAGPGGLRIGGMTLVPAHGMSAVPGQYVTVTGRMSGGRLLAGSLAPDLVASDPFARFGPKVGRMFVESYVTASDGHLRLTRGPSVRAPAGMAGALKPGWAVMQLERGAGAGPRAVGARFIAGPGRMPSPPRATPPRATPPRATPYGAEGGFAPGRFGGERPPEPLFPSRAYPGGEGERGGCRMPGACGPAGGNFGGGPPGGGFGGGPGGGPPR